MTGGIGDDELQARMELLHAQMERRGRYAATGDDLAQRCGFGVLLALLDGQADEHADAWHAFEEAVDVLGPGEAPLEEDDGDAPQGLP